MKSIILLLLVVLAVIRLAAADNALSVEGLDEGIYAVEWWHTLEGKRLTLAESRVVDGKLNLMVPDFSVDLAARIRRR